MNNKELIEFVFYHEQDIKRAVFEKREDGCLPKTGGGGSGHCCTSDKTAQQAIRSVMGVGSVVVEYGAATCGKRNSVTVRHPEKWLKVIQYTRDYFNGTASGALFKMRYAECLTRQEICENLKINKPRYFAMLGSVIKFAEGTAVGLGLLNIKH